MKAEMDTSTDSTLENKKVAKVLFETLAGPLKSKSYSSYQLLAQLDNYNNTLSKELFDMLLNEQDENGNTLLHLAVEQGDFTVFPALMKRKANLDLNIKNIKGETALSLAIKKGRSYDARDIIVAGADLNIQYKNGNTLLHLAVEQDDFTVFPALMKRKDIKLNIQNNKGDTALSLAIKKGRSYNARDIIQAGADLNIQYENGNTALHLAIEQDDFTVFPALMKRKDIKLNIQNNKGDTALSLAIKKGRSYNARDIIQAGADLNIQYENGNTALHLAIEQDDFTVFPALMKRKDIKLNIQNNKGDTALSLAIKKGRSYNARDIIQAGADLNIQYENGNTALHLAIEQDDFTVFPALMKRKDIKLNIQNNKGDTALSLAIKKGRSYNARDIIQAGADLNIQYENGNTALHLAIEKRDFTVFDALMKRKADLDLNKKNDNDKTPLDLAIENKNIDFVYKLIKSDSKQLEIFLASKSNLDIQDSYGHTLLHYAVMSKDKELLEKLIKAESNVNIQDNEGNNPLHLVAKNGYIDITKELIRAGSNINIQDKEGNTALILAMKNNRHDIVEELLKNPAIDLNLSNKFGESPLKIAFENDNIDLAKKLIKQGAKITEDALPKRLNNGKLLAFFKKAIKEGDSELVKVLATEFKDKLKEKYLTMITGRTLHSYAVAKGKTEIAAELEKMGFKKQKTIKEYIVPIKKKKEVNQQFDAILDSMENGTLSSTDDQTPKKKSWKKQLKEAFYPTTKTTPQKASLELLEKPKISGSQRQ